MYLCSCGWSSSRVKANSSSSAITASAKATPSLRRLIAAFFRVPLKLAVDFYIVCTFVHSYNRTFRIGMLSLQRAFNRKRSCHEALSSSIPSSLAGRSHSNSQAHWRRRPAHPGRHSPPGLHPARSRHEASSSPAPNRLRGEWMKICHLVVDFHPLENQLSTRSAVSTSDRPRGHLPGAVALEWEG